MTSRLFIICCWSMGTVLPAFSQDKIAPPARSGYVMAYDESRKVVVIFGGQDTASRNLGDTWEWSAKGWTQIDIAGPSARINASMAYDGVANRMVLFGGRDASGPKNDLWAYDGKSWSRINLPSSPPVRQLGTMVFDKSQSAFVLFGGMDASKKPMGDTWVLKNNKWMALEASGPVPRASHSMVYDDEAKAVFIYGGYVNDAGVNDFWELKDGKWFDVTLKSGPGRIHASLSYDRENGMMLLFGGFNDEGRTNELWEYLDKNKQWAIVNTSNGAVPQPRAEHRAVFIPGAGLFVFGGVIGVDPNTRNRNNDTWLYNSTGWKKLD